MRKKRQRRPSARRPIQRHIYSAHVHTLNLLPYATVQDTEVSYYHTIIVQMPRFSSRLEASSVQPSPGDDIGPVSRPGLISGKGQHRPKLEVILSRYAMSVSHLYLPNRASALLIAHYV